MRPRITVFDLANPSNPRSPLQSWVIIPPLYHSHTKTPRITASGPHSPLTPRPPAQFQGVISLPPPGHYVWPRILVLGHYDPSIWFPPFLVLTFELCPHFRVWQPIPVPTLNFESSRDIDVWHNELMSLCASRNEPIIWSNSEGRNSEDRRMRDMVCRL